MPQLTLNNWAVPVVEVKTGFKEIGSVRRAASGVLRRMRAAVKREWSVRTPPMPYDDAVALAGLVLGRGEYWPADTDTFSSKGLAVAQDNGVEAAPGKFSNGFVARRPIINLFAPNVRTGTDALGDTTGFSTMLATFGYNGSAGTGTVASSTSTDAWQGSRTCYVDLPSAGMFEGVMAEATVAPSTAYVFSAYVKSSAGNVDLMTKVWPNNSSGFSQGPYSFGPVSDTEWTRLTNRFTTGPSTTAVRCLVQQTSYDGSNNFYTDAWQLEAGTSASPWSDGAGTGANLAYDVTRLVTSHCDAITFSCWAKSPSVGGTLFALRAVDGDVLIKLAYSATHELTATIINEAGEATALGGAWPSPTTFAHIALVIRQAPVAADAAQLFVRGEMIGAGSGTMPELSGLRLLYIGNDGEAANQWGSGGVIDEINFLPYAASPSMLEAMAGASSAQGKTPQLVAGGDVVHGGAYVLGSDVEAQVTAGYVAGTWHPNLVSLEFVLSEV